MSAEPEIKKKVKKSKKDKKVLDDQAQSEPKKKKRKREDTESAVEVIPDQEQKRKKKKKKKRKVEQTEPSESEAPVTVTQESETAAQPEAQAVDIESAAVDETAATSSAAPTELGDLEEEPKRRRKKKKKKKVEEEYYEEEEEGSTVPYVNRTAQARPVRVFLGNLSFKVTEEALKKVFKTCGEITSIHKVLDKKTAKFYGTAFAEFEDPEGAKLALGYNGKKLLGRPMKVGWATGGKTALVTAVKAAPLSAKHDGCVMCFLGNLPYDVEEDDVLTFFEGCGEIVEVRWVGDGNDFKGCGFVEFADTADTDLAVQKNGSILKGRPVRVDYAPYREGRGAR